MKVGLRSQQFLTAVMQVFNNKFNLGFGQPKTDTCSTCEEKKNLLVSSVNQNGLIRKEQEEHLYSAKLFYDSLRINTGLAK